MLYKDGFFRFPSLYLVWSRAWKLKYRSSLLIVLLLCMVCLVLARPVAMESFATSRNLLTVTNSLFHEVFSDVFSTSLWLSCGKLVYSYCLQDHLTLPSSDYLIFRIVVDGRTILSYVLLLLQLRLALLI